MPNQMHKFYHIKDQIVMVEKPKNAVIRKTNQYVQDFDNQIVKGPGFHAVVVEKQIVIHANTTIRLFEQGTIVEKAVLSHAIANALEYRLGQQLISPIKWPEGEVITSSIFERDNEIVLAEKQGFDTAYNCIFTNQILCHWSTSGVCLGNQTVF